MTTQVLEGTWEEITRHAKDLTGRKVRVTILEDKTSPKPNEKALEVIRKVSDRRKKMPESSGKDTLKMIQEARSGGMFGNESDD